MRQMHPCLIVAVDHHRKAGMEYQLQRLSHNCQQSHIFTSHPTLCLATPMNQKYNALEMSYHIVRPNLFSRNWVMTFWGWSFESCPTGLQRHVLLPENADMVELRHHFPTEQISNFSGETKSKFYKILRREKAYQNWFQLERMHEIVLVQFGTEIFKNPIYPIF